MEVPTIAPARKCSRRECGVSHKPTMSDSDPAASDFASSTAIDPVEEYEWDPSQSIATAWSTTATRKHRGRRTYGRHAQAKKGGNAGLDLERNKKKGGMRRIEVLDPETGSGDLPHRSSSDLAAEAGSASSLSSFDFASKSLTSVPGKRKTLPWHRRRSASASSSNDTSRCSSPATSSIDIPATPLAPEQPGMENSHPNVLIEDEKETGISAKLHPRPIIHKRVDTLGKGDLGSAKKGKIKRKSRRQKGPETAIEGSLSPTFSSHSSNSFSSLAKSGEIAPSWLKQSLKDFVSKQSAAASTEANMCLNRVETFSPVGDLAAFPAESPTRSLTASVNSSRKRGVCASPFLDLDDPFDLSSTGGVSTSRASSSSYRSRARSRIFSPESTKKIMASAVSALKQSKAESEGTRHRSTNQKEQKNDKCETDTEPETSRINESMSTKDSNENSGSESDSFSSDGIDTERHAKVALPPRPLRCGSSANFHETVFGPVGNSKENERRLSIVKNPRNKNPFAQKDFLDSIPSYDDLKFIIKALRKSQHSNTIASFGSKSCTIVPPNAWPSDKKAAFFRWATTRLGFSLRSGGASVAFLQTTSEKGTSMLALLEEVLIEHKAKMLDQQRKISGQKNPIPDHPVASRNALRRQPIAELDSVVMMTFSAKKDKVAGTPLFPVTTLHLRARTTTPGVQPVASPIDCNVDSAILDKLGTLSITEVSSSRIRDSSSRNPDSESIAEAQMLVTSCDEADTPLVRMVTLDAHNQDARFSVSSELTGMQRDPSVSPNNSSFEIRRRPRLSAEHTVGGQDLVNHLHGISPNENTSKPRASMFSFPRQIGKTSQMGELVSNLNQSTVTPVFSHTLTDISNPVAEDFVETPMPKRNSQIWGSRPIPGKDWGQSTRCDDKTIKILLKRLEVSFPAPEFCAESSWSAAFRFDHFQVSPLLTESCLVPPSIVATAASSADLGFEFEADDAPPLDSCTEHDHSGLPDTKIQKYMRPEDASKAAGKSRRHTHIVADNNSDMLQEPERRGSVGASLLMGLNLNEEEGQSAEKMTKRRLVSIAKHKRISLCAAALDSFRPPRLCSRNTNVFSQGGGTLDNVEAIALNSSYRRRSCGPLLVPKVRAPRSSCTSLYSPAKNDLMEHVGKFFEPQALNKTDVLSRVFSFLDQGELLCSASLVCSCWADAATDAYASLMLVSVGCSTSFIDGSSTADDSTVDDDESTSVSNEINPAPSHSITKSMERPWKFLIDTFPWAAFLSAGGYKRVYRVWNSNVEAYEAVSVMDIDFIESAGEKNVVGAELAVSVMLSSLVRRNVCPNFVIIRGVFTCPYKPPASHWGDEDHKKPKGDFHVPGKALGRKPREPTAKDRGRFQYIRMELCIHGDMEEFIKMQPGQVISPEEARCLLFQMAFSLHAAGDRFGMKHYDVKLLNFFLQNANDETVDATEHPDTVLRYGVGSHVFRLRMDTRRALIAKLADFGTANVRPETDGQPVTIAQFTTLENSPPDFLILGDAAKQGYGHDCFGLGLCMLHLFTGHAPYEEILEQVTCPPTLKRKLRRIWEDESSTGYDVLRNLILADVYIDEDGNVEGEPDEVLYDTLYRYLVLFGVPDEKFHCREHGRVWRAISSSLGAKEQNFLSAASEGRGRAQSRKQGQKHQEAPDAAQFTNDCMRFSLLYGQDERIASARERLQMMDGGMELLFSLVCFNPNKRATPLDVINSSFMAPLREEPGLPKCAEKDIVYSFMAYATQ